MDDGVFSIDFAIAYAVFAVLILLTFFTAMNAISVRYTASYANDLAPLAERTGDMLLGSTGTPQDWYMSPYAADNASLIGLSNGQPNVLSLGKVDGLGMINATRLKGLAGLPENDDYGLRVEIRSSDGAVSRSAGYPLPPDTANVYKSTRIAVIKETDDLQRNAFVTIYLWRKDVGTAAA